MVVSLDNFHRSISGFKEIEANAIDHLSIVNGAIIAETSRSAGPVTASTQDLTINSGGLRRAIETFLGQVNDLETAPA